MPATEDLVARVERLCDGDLSAKVLRERVIAEVRRAVPFEGFLFALTDPVTRVGTSPLADVPMLPWERLPELIRWRYLTPFNRWDRIDRPVSLRAAGTPSGSPMWRHVLHELGVVDTCTTPFVDAYGGWGLLDLWRTRDVFTAADEAFLARLQPIVTRGLRRAVARTFLEPPEPSPLDGPAVVVLDVDLRVQAQTSAAARALLQLNPPDEPIAPVPAAAYNIGAALLAAEVGLPIGEPWSRLHLGGGRWITVRADRMGADIAVTIQPSTPLERTDVFSRSHGLSARESQVLGLLAAGRDSREIANELVLSEHTVTDHVKAVLAKTGSRTRQVLLARAAGSTY